MKIGDYIKVKDGTELDNGELSKNWAGKIIAIDDEDDNFITIEKDAQTLDSLSDEYIQYGIDNDLAEYIYVFEKKDLELSERRDTDEMYHDAVQRYDARYERIDDDVFVEQLENMDDEDFEEMFGGEEEIQQAYFDAMEITAQQFFKSPLAERIVDIDEGDANFIIEMFVHYAMTYRDEMMDDWSKNTIDEICLDVIPRKVSMEAEDFQVMGKVLKYYFDYLAAERLIKNRKLGDYVYSKRREIYNNSQNPANWGMAKSMMMGAVEQGVDTDDEDALKAYLDSQMFKPFSLPNSYQSQYTEPAKRDELKNIGRNEKVTVKYKDGKIVKDVKFKKVMKDVKSGKCVLV